MVNLFSIVRPSLLRSNRDTGIRGEEIARRYLLRQGLRILEKNFRVRGGEIDLVAKEGEVIVFVEVKTRISGSFGSPGESITPSKVKSLQRTALFYLRRKGLPPVARFDVVNIYLTPRLKVQSLEWIRNALPFEDTRF